MLWTRAVGRRDRDLRMAEGRVAIDSDSYVMQIGGDLLRAPAGWRGPRRPDGRLRRRPRRLRVHVDPSRRRGPRSGARRTSGYAGGLYGTTMPTKPTGWAPMRMPGSSSAVMTTGSAATWVPPATSRVWSASLEGGYAIKPFAPESALADLVIEPHAQIIHARYRANDAMLQDTRMRSDRNRATLLRGGVRLYPGLAARIAARSAPLSRPTGCAATRRRPSGWTTTRWPRPRHATRSNSNWAWTPARRTQVSAQLIGQFGGGERGYGGMLNLSHAW